MIRTLPDHATCYEPFRLQNTKLLLEQGERVRRGLETQVVELQDQLKQAQGPEPAKEVLMKVGRRVGYPSLCFPFSQSILKCVPLPFRHSTRGHR